MKVSQVKVGMILSYIQIIAQILVNFLFTPLMLRALGQSEYGLYATATSTIASLSILSLGFGSSYIKKFSEYKSRDDEDAISRLNGLFFLIFTVIGIVSLICGLFLTFNLKLIFADGLTPDEFNTAKVLMLLLVINLSLNFPLSVFNSIIGAHEKFIFQKIVYMLKVIGGPMLMIPVLLLGYSSIGLVVTTLSVNLIADIMNIYYCYHHLHIKVKFGGWEKGLFCYLFKYTSYIAIGLIVDQINWNIDKILLGRFKGTSSVAVYSVGHTLFSCYNSVGGSTGNLFTPRIHAIANQHKCQVNAAADDFTAYMIKVGRIQFMLIMLVCLGFTFYGKYFLNLWAGPGYENAYWVTIILMYPAMITLVQSLGIEMQRALDKHKFRSVFYLLTAVCNLTISIFLCQRYGEIGCALGTAIALILSDGFAINIYYKRVLHIDVKSFWKSLLRVSVGFIIPIAFGVVCMKYLNTANLVFYVLQIATFSIIYGASLYFISMNPYEKQLVANLINKIIKR